MKAAKYIAIIGVLAMSAVLVYGFTVGDFSADGASLLKNPWGIVSLVDLYVGFSFFSLWIAYREKNKWIAMVWIVLMMVLGFFTGSVYVLYAIWQSKGDRNVLMFGEDKKSA